MDNTDTKKTLEAECEKFAISGFWNGVLVCLIVVLLYFIITSSKCKDTFKSMFKNSVNVNMLNEAIGNAYGNDEYAPGALALPCMDSEKKKEELNNKFTHSSNNVNVNYVDSTNMLEYNPAEAIKDENIDKTHGDWAEELSKKSNQKSAMMLAEFETKMDNYNPLHNFRVENHGIQMDKNAA